MDVNRLPDPATMVQILEAIRSHQPRSRVYQRMTETVYYAGLRPSEVVMLRPRVLCLPEHGWGWIDVLEADDGYDEPAEPKTGDRRVPIPPALLASLRSWTQENELGPDDLLFRAKNGGRPHESNWGRALHRACRSVHFREIAVYECRDTCATTWLRAGVPLGEVAIRLGHTVETLVSRYVGALQGDDHLANEKIDAALTAADPRAQAAAWILIRLWELPRRNTDREQVDADYPPSGSGGKPSFGPPPGFPNGVTREHKITGLPGDTPG